MNLEKLKQEIKFEEGVMYEIYNDHLGYKTFGIGHLCRPTDPENDMEVGTEISEERVNECFENDLDIALGDAQVFCKDMDIDENAEECVVHMVFQLGLTRLNKFVKFKKALQENDIQEAMNQMKDSKWYNQTTNRANRLIEKMGKSISKENT